MIGIIYVGDIRYCPYIDKYLMILKQENKSYEVLFWNRENTNINKFPNYYSFNLRSKLGKHPLFKTLDFLQFRVWIKKIISSKKYDKLIILSTLSGILMANTLIKKYKNNYIFDIRDYSYENYKLFYKLEETIIRNSRFTCISSEGFKNFLPKDYRYVISHNFDYKDLENRKIFKKKKKDNVINIVWIGSVRYYEHQSKIIKQLKNDKRFNLIFHGSGPDLEKLKKFCMDNNIVNVTFTGFYDNKMKKSLLYNADILNNSYGIKNFNKVKYAISNKFYDGLIFKIPQLVEINTYKHTKVEELGVGIGLDVEQENFADKLYEYYFNIDEKEFNDSCDNEIQKILMEDQLYLEKIREFINS